jgi:hypothetical protein
VRHGFFLEIIVGLVSGFGAGMSRSPILCMAVSTHETLQFRLAR